VNQAVNRRSEFVDGRPPSPQMVTVEVDGPAVGEAGAPFELARILDFGARLCITERCHLLDDARSLLPCVALYPTAATRSSGSSPWARLQ
jgi:hypothetical protein